MNNTSYSAYHDSFAPSQTPNFAPKVARQAGRVRPAQVASMGATGARRQVSITPNSSVSDVRVISTGGKLMAHLTSNKRSANLQGHGDVGVVLVSLDGEERSCDMSPTLDWIDATTHIGVEVGGRRGNVECTLVDMDAGVSVPDMWGATPGQRCVYVSDQKGRAGLECY